MFVLWDASMATEGQDVMSYVSMKTVSLVALIIM